MTNQRIQLLDCTLRDGGFGLEDAVKTHFSDRTFDVREIPSIIRLLRDTDIDIIELGAVEQSADDKRKFAIYQTVEAISETIPSNPGSNQMYVLLFRGPDIPADQIPEWKKGYCDGVRVIIRYSELKKSMDFCSMLAQKGYRVFVQPMLTMRYTPEEIQMLIREANQMKAYALYFVDSYGYMTPGDVKRLFDTYDQGLDPDVRIGFHAHNNMNLAFANVRSFLDIDTNRSVIVDSCITGMGQGAGNLQTELIADYLITSFGKNYRYDAVLDLCEIIEKYLTQNIWGYSVTRLLPALRRTAYKYAMALRNQYGLCYREINTLLATIPEDLRHRYTPDNAKRLLTEGLPGRIQE